MKTGFIGGKFLPFHLGHLNAIIEAYSLCDKLYVVLSYSEKRDRNYCKKGDIKYMPYSVRLSWIRRAVADMDNVEVVAIEDTAYDDESYDWQEGADNIKKAIGGKIDFVFSSEESYGPIFEKLYPKAKHVLMDPKRSLYNISGTKIREEGVFRHWDMIPDVVKPFFVKKIVIVGTESCGKSTLVRNLAKVFNTSYVHEYGRDVCEQVGGADVLIPEDFRRIAYGHKMLEYEMLQVANKVLFIDTDVLITKYYYELYLKGIDNGLFDKMFDYEDYDLWVFLEPDVKWVNDGTRTFGDDDIRKRNNVILKRMLDEKGIDYVCIKGSYHERLLKVRETVEDLVFMNRK